MAESEDLGKIINERRLALGYSLGQLANRVGATATQVREWEKSGGTPDADTIPKLGSVLGVDPIRLAAAKPGNKVSPPARPPQPKPEVVDQRNPSAAGAVTAAAGTAPTGRPPADEPTSMIGASSPPPAGAPSPTAPATPAPVFSDASATGDVDAGPRIEDMPTEAVDVVPASAPEPPASSPSMAPVPSSVATATRRPTTSWPDATPDTTRRDGIFGPLNQFVATVLDPNRRYLFWLRVGLTIIVLLIFAMILSNVVPSFFDALKDILDTIESTTEDPSLTSTTLPSN